jgi:hypothetical protein
MPVAYLRAVHAPIRCLPLTFATELPRQLEPSELAGGEEMWKCLVWKVHVSFVL